MFEDYVNGKFVSVSANRCLCMWEGVMSSAFGRNTLESKVLNACLLVDIFAWTLSDQYELEWGIFCSLESKAVGQLHFARKSKSYSQHQDFQVHLLTLRYGTIWPSYGTSLQSRSLLIFASKWFSRMRITNCCRQHPRNMQAYQEYTFASDELCGGCLDQVRNWLQHESGLSCGFLLAHTVSSILIPHSKL